jgi:regulator of replication initiation timing
MAFKDLLTRRKLLKENEALRAENRHLSIELRNARADLAIEQLTSRGYRNENRTLRNKLKAYESLEPETVGFKCVGVEK